MMWKCQGFVNNSQSYGFLYFTTFLQMQTVEETKHSGWFFSNCIYLKVGENSTSIKHNCDIEKALNMENIDSCIGTNA